MRPGGTLKVQSLGGLVLGLLPGGGRVSILSPKAAAQQGPSQRGPRASFSFAASGGWPCGYQPTASSPPPQGSHNKPLRPSVCLVLTLCDPVDCSPLGSSVHGDSPGKNNGVRSHPLLQGVFPTQGSNPGLPHCRRILYQLSHEGSHGGVPQAWYRSAFIWLPCR